MCKRTKNDQLRFLIVFFILLILNGLTGMLKQWFRIICFRVIILLPAMFFNLLLTKYPVTYFQVLIFCQKRLSSSSWRSHTHYNQAGFILTQLHADSTRCQSSHQHSRITLLLFFNIYQLELNVVTAVNVADQPPACPARHDGLLTRMAGVHTTKLAVFPLITCCSLWTR